MRQLFSVGEEVMLCSKIIEGGTKDCTVVKVLVGGEKYTCRVTGKNIVVDAPVTEYSYLLDELCVNPKSGNEQPWAQTRLRKKHKPSTESFSEIMRNLNTIKV